MNANTSKKTAAIITAFKPDAQFSVRFDQAATYCDIVIVVDNTPGTHRFENLNSKFVVFQDGVNKGLGAALNAGLAVAKQQGVELVFLFDQDSSPTGNLLQALVEALDSEGTARVCIGPLLVDDQAPTAKFPVAHDLTSTSLLPMTCLATSGMAFNLGALAVDDDFSTDLFLDFVDFEWCWRLGRRGWRFYKLTSAPMPHRLGLAQRHLFGLTYHVPSPYRHYYQFRDTLRLVRWNYTPMYSKFRLAGILPLKLLVYPFIMDRGLERLGWMFRGIADSFNGIRGIGAAKAKLG
jgi:rhamnosyltransferase